MISPTMRLFTIVSMHRHRVNQSIMPIEVFAMASHHLISIFLLQVKKEIRI
jgi:hypothetical protein